VMTNASASQISIAYGLRGPTFAVASACASANHAIIQAAQMIRYGMADVAIAGGTEACLTYGALRAWEAMRVLADDTCRPFSINRRGLVLGEGAGIFVLESMEHAQARGAVILAELAGVGMTADASDIVMPNATGAAAAMTQAMADADLAPQDVDYINAHGTGTQANDSTETRAIRLAFGAHADRLAVSSTKSMHGHALGASGALELVAVVGALRDGVVPPTANLDEVDPACDLDYVPNVGREMPVRAALSNSFAFGGLNAVLALKRAP
jgi:nodulation protein E